MESGEEGVHEPILIEGHPGLNHRLEKVLSDPQLSYFKRLQLASWLELKLLFPLAAPAVLVYLINNFMSLSTRVFCGHLGNLQLAAASLGNSGIQLLSYGLMVITKTRKIILIDLIGCEKLIPYVFIFHLCG